jgi:hypothetical protein
MVNAVAKSHAVKFARVGSKLHFDVARTLSPSQFCKNYDAKLLVVAQAPYARLAAIARRDDRKVCPWNELHDLREQALPDKHMKSPSGLYLGKYSGIRKRVSNRHKIKIGR